MIYIVFDDTVASKVRNSDRFDRSADADVF